MSEEIADKIKDLRQSLHHFEDTTRTDLQAQLEEMLDRLKPQCEAPADPTLTAEEIACREELYHMVLSIQASLKGIADMIRILCTADLDLFREKRLSQEQYLERLTTYDSYMEDLTTAVRQCLWSPNAYLHHLKQQFKDHGGVSTATATGVTLLGAVLGGLVGAGKLHFACLGCCKVGIAGATGKALALYIGAGMGIGLAVVLLGLAAYHVYSTSKEKSEAQKLQEQLDNVKKNLTFEKVRDLGRDVKSLVATNGMQTLPHDSQCTICMEQMSPCAHLNGLNHDQSCAIVPFKCNRHSVCWKCFSENNITVCPECREPLK